MRLSPESAWLLAALAVAITTGSLLLLLRFASRLPHALPGQRSLHDAAVPRVGGIAIWTGYLPIALLGPPAIPAGWMICLLASAAVGAISLVDDCRGVPPLVRLLAQCAAALAVALVIVRSGPAPGAGALPLAVAGIALVIVWAANLYNFMDGSDGLAAVMGVLGFGAYGVAALLARESALPYFGLAAALLPFLWLNLPPARMFMGDVGAVPLGFLAAALGVAGWRSGIWPAWFPLLVFLPFIADATATLAQRIGRRERIWEAHKMHYYQRLNQLGAGHGGTLFAFGVLMSGSVVAALFTLAVEPDAGWPVVFGWTAAVAAFFCGIDYHWRNRAPIQR